MVSLLESTKAHLLVELPMSREERSRTETFHHFAILVKECNRYRINTLFQKDLATLLDKVMLNGRERSLRRDTDNRDNLTDPSLSINFLPLM